MTRSELSRNPWQNIKYLQVRDPSNRAVAWPASVQIDGNKRTFFTKEKSSAPTGFVWKPIWRPFHCFGTLIWPP